MRGPSKVICYDTYFILTSAKSEHFRVSREWYFMFQIKSPLQVEMYGRMTWNLLFHGVGGIKLELHFSETMGAKPPTA